MKIKPKIELRIENLNEAIEGILKFCPTKQVKEIKEIVEKELKFREEVKRMELNELQNGKVEITIAGEKVEVNASDPVKVTLKSLLQTKGIDSFTIIVDGDEVESTSDLPETFAGHVVEVQRYVKPGIV